MTAQYLDKEKVLKAMSECDGNPPLNMETRIKEGKFDAPMEPIGSRILYLAQIKKLLESVIESVNEKDAEIAQLKQTISDRENMIRADTKEINNLRDQLQFNGPNCNDCESYRMRYVKEADRLATLVKDKDAEIARLNEEFPMALACDRNRLDVIETGMAKDIGNLTLRVDNLEKGVEISHDRCLRLETAFKSLKEEVNGIPITAENGTIYSLKVKREL
jgi:chromosome segregation ATPase